MSRYKFVDEDKTREYFEVTTEAMQYHWGEGVRYLGSAPNQMVGLDGKLWSAEVLRNKKWFYVGSFKTGREARKAAIDAYEARRSGGLMDADKPKPGSPDAIKQGCVCPILDNAHGAGVGGDGGKFGWWISGYCPLHGEENGNSPRSTR